MVFLLNSLGVKCCPTRDRARRLNPLARCAAMLQPRQRHLRIASRNGPKVHIKNLIDVNKSLSLELPL